MSTSLRVLATSLTLALCCAGCPQGGSTPATPGTSAAKQPGSGSGGGGKTQAEPPAKPKFDRATAKTPWKYAAVGDWATYSIEVGGGKKRTMKFVVTAVDDATVKFDVLNADTGEVQQTATIDLAEEESRYKAPDSYDALDGAPQTKTIDFKGRQLEVVILKRKREGMGSTELWLAEKDVRPFNQCAVKSFKDGELKMELLDFGTAK